MESTYCSARHILRAQSIIANYWVRARGNEEQGAVYNTTKCELVLFCVLIRLNERKGRWPFILFSSASVDLKTSLKKMTLSCFPFFLRNLFDPQVPSGPGLYLPDSWEGGSGPGEGRAWGELFTSSLLLFWDVWYIFYSLIVSMGTGRRSDENLIFYDPK